MTAVNGNGNGTPSLHELLLTRMEGAGIRSQTAMTVMAPHRDPYRLEKYRAQAEWLAEAMKRIPNRPVHVRGLHYAAIGTRLPDGTQYANTDESYVWMQDKPAKAARWLGLVPWEDIIDKKNDTPRVHLWEPPQPQPQIVFGNVEISFPEDLAPEPRLDDFRGEQTYKLVIFAEKAAVAHVVDPLAERYAADTYLESGEISDTHLHQIAKIGTEDGRPVAVLTLSDADPSGYWMPCTIAYKLQALRDSQFPDLAFEVHPIGLLPEQVHKINADGDPLPSSPLKAGEKRATAWERTFGIEQIELDAIATLRPDVLEEIVRAGIKPFFDTSLDRRVREARRDWEARAGRMLADQLGEELINRLRVDAEARLAELRDEVEAVNDQLWVDTDGVALPPMPEIPAPKLNGIPSPLASTEMEFDELVRRLKARGEYARPA